MDQGHGKWWEKVTGAERGKENVRDGERLWEIVSWREGGEMLLELRKGGEKCGEGGER